MIGKASEIKTTLALHGIIGLDSWLVENPDCSVLQILISPSEGTDYFYIIYKEELT